MNIEERNNKNMEYYNRMVSAGSQDDRLYWRNKMVELNMSLVEWAYKNLVNNMYNSSGIHDDILQELYIILIRAVEKWNPDKGALSTYFYRAAGYNISRIFGFNDGLIRIPVITLNNVGKFMEQYKKDNSISITSYCKQNKLDEKVLLSAELCTRYKVQSLDRVVGYDEDGNEISGEETVTYQDAVYTEDKICKKEFNDTIDQLLDIVCRGNEEDKGIMWLYINGYTYVNIGRMLEKPRKDVEEVVKKHIHELRRPVYSRKLVQCLD